MPDAGTETTVPDFVRRRVRVPTQVEATTVPKTGPTSTPPAVEAATPPAPVSAARNLDDASAPTDDALDLPDFSDAAQSSILGQYRVGLIKRLRVHSVSA